VAGSRLAIYTRGPSPVKSFDTYFEGRDIKLFLSRLSSVLLSLPLPAHRYLRRVSIKRNDPPSHSCECSLGPCRLPEVLLFRQRDLPRTRLALRPELYPRRMRVRQPYGQALLLRS